MVYKIWQTFLQLTLKQISHLKYQILKVSFCKTCKSLCEKISLWGFRPGLTQTRLYMQVTAWLICGVFLLMQEAGFLTRLILNWTDTFCHFLDKIIWRILVSVLTIFFSMCFFWQLPFISTTLKIIVKQMQHKKTFIMSL